VLKASSPAVTRSEVNSNGMTVATRAARGFFMVLLLENISAYAHIVA
jgi:hypothetical protein